MPIHDPGPRPTLRGCRILVVEDEYFLADDIARAVERLGGEVVGPVGEVEEGLDALSGQDRVDGAVLDINLREEMIYPVADALRRRGIPFVFATGYDQAVVPGEYHDVLRWEKPFDPAALARALPDLVSVG